MCLSLSAFSLFPTVGIVASGASSNTVRVVQWSGACELIREQCNVLRTQAALRVGPVAAPFRMPAS